MNESYVVTGDYAGEVHLFYADSGSVKHTQTDPTDDTRNVIIQGETYVAGTDSTDGNVYAYSTDNGSLRWSSQPFGTTDRIVGLAAKTGIIGVYQQTQGIKFFDILSGAEYNENTTVSGQQGRFVASKNSEYMALPNAGDNVVTTFESGEIVGKQDVI
jgi:outer membrane protein assembly factor BamB